MFAAMTAHRSRAEVRAIARRATLAAAGLLTFFALFGGVPSRSSVFSWVHFAPPAA
jgi:small neutral amino acid transporter SnatA (MarC family)